MDNSPVVTTTAAAAPALPGPANRLIDDRLADALASASHFVDDQRQLHESFHAQGLHMEGRRYRMVGRPLLIEKDEFSALADDCSRFHQVLEHAIDLYAQYPEIRSLFAEYRDHLDAILDYPPSRPRIPLCRFDCIWRGGADFKIVETNTSAPSGVVQVPMAIRSWLATEWAERLLSGLDRAPYPLLEDSHAFTRSLVASARSAGYDVQAAAIANLQGVYTNEVEWIVRHFRELGLEAQLIDARSVRERGDAVVCAGQEYQLVYNKLDPLMLLAEPAAVDHRQAFRNHRALFVNPLIALTFTEDKAIFAILSDPTYAPLFSDDERAIIARHVPWTRLVQAGRTTAPDGSIVDLVAYAAANRERLVLKPANLTRGAAVLIGPHTAEDEWQRGVREALANRCVVQEYVPLPQMAVPTEDGSGTQRLYVDLSCHIFGGQLAGFFSRASQRPIVNMGSGGACVPVVMVERPAAGAW